MDRDTASMPHAEIRNMILNMEAGELSGPHIPVEIDSLEQLAYVLEDIWRMKLPVRSSPLDVERALDRWEVWTSGRVAIRRLRGARRDR